MVWVRHVFGLCCRSCWIESVGCFLMKGRSHQLCCLDGLLYFEGLPLQLETAPVVAVAADENYWAVLDPHYWPTVVSVSVSRPTHVHHPVVSPHVSISISKTDLSNWSISCVEIFDPLMNLTQPQTPQRRDRSPQNWYHKLTTR